MLFSDLNLPASLVDVTAELGYTQMTLIQEKSIPVLLQGKDFVGQSKTGSGKTAAFSLPVLARIQLRPRMIQSLILCPTRELCTQVAREIRRLARRMPGLQVLILSGGQPIGPQLGALEKGAHIVVGTPGRVNDLIQRRRLDLRGAGALILDEADRMLDMGFEAEMDAILSVLPRKSQRVFFSATFPDSIEEMSQKFQRDPVRVTIKTDSVSKPQIEQSFIKVQPTDKIQILIRLLEERPFRSAIIFTNMKATARDTAVDLNAAGLRSGSIHGDLEQFERDQVMAQFRNQSLRVLVATDVAARGIDIPDLDLVVNYELPSKAEVYVHRIGRTGRAGKTGLAISMFSPKEAYKVEKIGEYTQTKPVLLKSPQDRRGSKAKEAPHELAEMATLSIAAGRKDKLRPGDILGALTGEAGGLQGRDVGKIEIHDRVAYVAVRRAVAHHALKSLQKGRIKGRSFKTHLLSS